jgi:hypothetical protein
MRAGLSRAIGLAAAAAAIMAAAPGAVADPCASLSEPEFPVCKSVGSGVVLAATAAEAEAAAAAALQGEHSFETHFGPVTRYAVVVGAGAAGLRARLVEAGFPIVLPWLNAAARHKGLEDSVRRSTEAQLQGKGLTPEQMEAAVAAALAQVGARQRDRLLTSYAAVAHELGHMWLIHAYWGGRMGGGAAGHYGGPAPDWLDEAAAIAMEEEALTAPRRTHFGKLVNGEEPGRVETLAAFFRMDHPLKGLAALVRSGALRTGGTDQVTVLTGAEVQSRLGVAPEAGPNFYAQSRVVADFLLESSGNAKILGDIARALAGGATIEQWLAASGRANRLGASLDALEVQWQAWIKARYGAAPATP